MFVIQVLDEVSVGLTSSYGGGGSVGIGKLSWVIFSDLVMVDCVFDVHHGKSS